MVGGVRPWRVDVLRSARPSLGSFMLIFSWELVPDAIPSNYFTLAKWSLFVVAGAAVYTIVLVGR